MNQEINVYRAKLRHPVGPTGCLKLQVICRKRATNYRVFHREMTQKDKASYGSSPPFTYINTK